MNTTERNIAAAVARRLNVSGGPYGGVGVEMHDPITPDYYRFPNGIEVIDISEHLTGNGAQVVQYVARATRTDGVVKGSPVEDLRKAQRLLDREIARIKAVRDEQI